MEKDDKNKGSKTADTVRNEIVFQTTTEKPPKHSKDNDNKKKGK